MIKTDTLSYLKNCISSPTDAAETMQSFIVKSDPKHLMLIYIYEWSKEPPHIQSLPLDSLTKQ